MSWELLATILGSVSVIAGSVVFLGGAVGLLRFPDLYVRSSAIGAAAGLGLVFVIVGAFLLHPTWEAAPKVVVAAILQFASSAIGAMSIARSGFLSGAAPTSATRYSQLEFSSDQPDGSGDEAPRPGSSTGHDGLGEGG
ncbi:cation:proton antiporter [Dietzia maris]|jgi:multicomponent Na+:H+ antiporter subunit G|uniref:cation:proton antiporter n=1 Tax=Dietzia maris TaxID=37915 RepID=UPI001048EBD5|nr:monovalent cation/H(+) antiporter subunit G [Dietzia maris]MCT1434295.1 monovalent cation/H(+) antiporter subunit G [Dietzia maris]MCT1521264.1 monovalent cation/H(+) antiporter subunit G [Dietzia maris]